MPDDPAADVSRQQTSVGSLSVDTVFATPTGSNKRVLSAVSSRTVGDCVSTIIYAKDSFAYDTLPAGSVSAGLLTSHTVERQDDAGSSLDTVREFDATFDVAGNPSTMTTTREDGATRTATVDYDPFKLVPVTLTTTATGVPTTQISLLRDQVTLNVKIITDPNGTQHGTEFDGFSRPVKSTVTPPGRALGVLSTTTFVGFKNANPPSVRQITQKVFTDAVADPDTAIGRTSTVTLDELGRETGTDLFLGTDYSTPTLIAGKRTYDSLGRVVFEADPIRPPRAGRPPMAPPGCSTPMARRGASSAATGGSRGRRPSRSRSNLPCRRTNPASSIPPASSARSRATPRSCACKTRHRCSPAPPRTASRSPATPPPSAGWSPAQPGRAARASSTQRSRRTAWATRPA